MAMKENELARVVSGGSASGVSLELRSYPMRLRWPLSGAITADHQSLQCLFSCAVRGLTDPTEQRMLREVLVRSESAVTGADVISHFAPSLRRAVAERVSGNGVEFWLSKDGHAALAETLKKSAEAVAFGCGLEVIGPFDLKVESQSFEQQQLREMQRAPGGKAGGRPGGAFFRGRRSC